jgi:UDP-N-acetyl-D-mannosaminuronate dehydrogenase
MSDGSGAPAKHLKRKLAAGDAVVGIIGLTWKAREFNQHTKFIELAGQIKSAMPDYVVQVLGSAMDRAHAKAFNGARVLISGVAYKKNIDESVKARR